MATAVHKSRKSLEGRLRRLETLKARLQKQIIDADGLIDALDDYCREKLVDCNCAGNDPNWRQQLEWHREHLSAMLLAVKERLKVHESFSWVKMLP